MLSNFVEDGKVAGCLLPSVKEEDLSPVSCSSLTNGWTYFSTVVYFAVDLRRRR